MNNEEKVRLHAFVNGRVQGVGFRLYVIQAAKILDVTGWVRNTTKGEVEVLAEGSRASLMKLLEYLRQGPRAAFVTDVRHEWGEATGEFRDFDVEYTV